MAKQHRILVADDDEMVRSVMRMLLAYRGYHVEEAVDGADAIEKFRKSAQQIDLVLMDVNMPTLGGQEALQELQRLNPSLKAVLLSGRAEPQAASTPNQTVRYLQKPFDNNEFYELVGQMLLPS